MPSPALRSPSPRTPSHRRVEARLLQGLSPCILNPFLPLDPLQSRSLGALRTHVPTSLLLNRTHPHLQATCKLPLQRHHTVVIVTHAYYCQRTMISLGNCLPTLTHRNLKGNLSTLQRCRTMLLLGRSLTGLTPGTTLRINRLRFRLPDSSSRPS